MSNTPTPQETWQDRFDEMFPLAFFATTDFPYNYNEKPDEWKFLKWQEHETLKAKSRRQFVKDSFATLLDTALSSSHTALVEKVQGKREVITGKSGSEYEKWQRYRNETLDDILKLIQDSV